MTDTVPNALTPDEWAAKAVDRPYYDAHGWPVEGRVGLGTTHLRVGRIEAGPRIDLPLPMFHACAALCLHGQPFGFTRAEAEAVKYMAEQRALEMRDLDRMDIPPDEWIENRLFFAAAKIAALLPPEAREP